MSPRAVEDVLGSVATAFRRAEVLKRPIWRPAGFLVEAAGHMRRAPRSPELSRWGHPAPECVRRGVRCVYFPPAAEAPQELTD